jgi:hypothetical protein
MIDVTKIETIDPWETVFIFTLDTVEELALVKKSNTLKCSCKWDANYKKDVDKVVVRQRWDRRCSEHPRGVNIALYQSPDIEMADFRLGPKYPITESVMK